MTTAEYDRFCDIIREHYRDGLTEDQIMGWYKRLQPLDGKAVLEALESCCQRNYARIPALGEILDSYYRDQAGRTAKPPELDIDGAPLGTIRKAIENKGNWRPLTEDEREGAEYFRRLLEMAHGLDLTETGKDRQTKALVLSQRAMLALKKFGGHEALKAACADSVFLARETFVKLYLEIADGPA